MDILKKQIIAVFNMCLAENTDSFISEQDIYNLLEISLKDTFEMTSTQDSLLVNNMFQIPEHGLKIADSIFSDHLLSKLILQRDLFLRIAVEVKRTFSAIPSLKFFDYMKLVRKYTMVQEDISEFKYSDLFASFILEFLEYSSSDPNASVNGFLGFMDQSVVAF